MGSWREFENVTVAVRLQIKKDEEDEMELTSQFAGTYWYLPPETFMTGRGSLPKINQKVR